jgi:twitching motility two-component system response regulator PilG
MKDAYAVAVLGFEQTEKIVLSSIFGLSARRSPRFLQAAAEAPAPDIYLVDASNPEAVARFKVVNAGRRVPSILIGDGDHGTGWPVLKRPLQWTRLFKAFDLAVTLPPHPHKATAPVPTLTPTASSAAVTARGADPFAPTMRITPPPRPTGAPITRPPAARPATQPIERPKTGRLPAVEADNVMVVDDSPAVREFMRTKLEPFAFHVDFAASGEEAVGLTATKHYTCVFLDVIMPGIDGYQVCKIIKTRKSIRPTAVVMLTSKSSPFDKIRGAMAGCDAYITKPVDEEKLLEVIAKFLPQPA